MLREYDYIIGGAGIVGSALALELKQNFPDKKILLVDKESYAGYHQTGHNSGVIHSGIYYKPNTLKSTNCLNGYQYLIEFCNTHKIPYKLGGKIIASRNENEDETLITLHQRANDLGLGGVRMLESRKEINKIEPFLSVSKGLHVPQTGVVDYKAVCKKMILLFTGLGGKCLFGTRIISKKRNELQTSQGIFKFEKLILALGLQSDRIVPTDYQIIPFRGEYFQLHNKLNNLVQSMVYPVPDLKYPFLGLHFTRGIDQNIEIGPNALLAFAREKYNSKYAFNTRDLIDLITNQNLFSFVIENREFAIQEALRSIFKRRMTNEIQSYFPKVTSNDFNFTRSGIRAQLMDPKGALVDDFIIENNDTCLHILNAPSPAATSSISIAKHIIKHI